MRRSRPPLRAMLVVTLAAIALVLAACSSSPQDDSQSESSRTPGNHIEYGGGPYLALSGGGFAAHTFHSAMIMSALSQNDVALEKLLGNIKSAAGTSGGSWFLSQLAYAQKFQNEIAKPNAAASWSTEGYIGQVADIYQNNSLPPTCPTLVKPLCQLLGNYAGYVTVVNALGGSDISWHDLVSQLVYQPWELDRELAGVSLSDNRLGWAADKTMVFTSGTVNHEVVLSRSDSNDQSLSFVSNDSTPSNSMVTPVTLIGSKEDINESGFLGGPLTFRYGPNVTDPGTQTASRSYEGPLDPSSMQVMDAATVSSAALAATSSVSALDTLVPAFLQSSMPTVAYDLANLAPAFSLDTFDNAGNTIDPSLSPQELADRGIVRMADGGYGDQTAAVHLMRHLHRQDALDEFSIVIFALAGNPVPEGSEFSGLSPYVANMFGYDTRDGVSQMCIGVCAEVTSSHVFDKKAVQDPIDGWAYQGEGGILDYLEFDVTTVQNDYFGIPEDKNGTIHVFTLFNDAPMLPTSDKAFAQYQTMVDTVTEGMLNQGGGQHLSKALGLVTEGQSKSS